MLQYKSCDGLLCLLLGNRNVQQFKGERFRKSSMAQGCLAPKASVGKHAPNAVYSKTERQRRKVEQYSNGAWDFPEGSMMT